MTDLPAFIPEHGATRGVRTLVVLSLTTFLVACAQAAPSRAYTLVCWGSHGPNVYADRTGAWWSGSLLDVTTLTPVQPGAKLQDICK